MRLFPRARDRVFPTHAVAPRCIVDGAVQAFWTTL
jgi:hypothetical protein